MALMTKKTKTLINKKQLVYILLGSFNTMWLCYKQETYAITTVLICNCFCGFIRPNTERALKKAKYYGE